MIEGIILWIVHIVFGEIILQSGEFGKRQREDYLYERGRLDTLHCADFYVSSFLSCFTYSMIIFLACYLIYSPEKITWVLPVGFVIQGIIRLAAHILTYKKKPLIPESVKHLVYTLQYFSYVALFHPTISG